MQNLIKSWIRYFIFIGVFEICMNLIYLAVPVYMMIVYDRVLFSFSKPTLYALSVGVLICLLVMGVMDYLRMRMLGQAGNHLVGKMMPFVLRSLHADSVSNKNQKYTRGIHDLEFLKDAICRGYLFHIFNLPWVLIYLGVLYMIHPLMGGMAIAGVFIISLFQIMLVRLGKKKYTIADVAFHSNADFFRTCCLNSDLISGMGMMPALIEKYKEGYQQSLAEKTASDNLLSGIGSVIRTLYGIILALVFGAGVFVFFGGEITAGAVFGSVMIVVRLLYPFEKSLSGMTVSIDALAAYRRLKAFVNTQKQKEMLSLPPPIGKFEVEGISLVLNSKPILTNISFSLDPGESLGIFGPSSTGKTSLCNALIGIWPVASGKVRLDGAEIALWSKDELGRYLGYMPQEPELFPVSVARNISRLGPVDSEKVVKAARLAGAHEMILKLPQGYDTLVQGKNLAASQRQFISMARALYDTPKFVILDEPHTHLDELSQKMVLNTLNGLKQNKITTVVITDRPNLLLNLDKLLVLKEGQVAMYGPRKEVIHKLMNKQQPQQAAGA